VPRTLGVLLGVFYFKTKFKNMVFAIGALFLAVFTLIYVIREMHSKIEKMEKILKSMNDDLNMVSRTMDNMYRNQQEAKQILKG